MGWHLASENSLLSLREGEGRDLLLSFCTTIGPLGKQTLSERYYQIYWSFGAQTSYDVGGMIAIKTQLAKCLRSSHSRHQLI